MKLPQLPSEWRRVPLSSVADVQTGLALGKGAKDDPVRLPYLRVANVQDGFLDLNEIKEVVIERAQVSRYSLRSGDVLMTEGGDFDKLGRGYIWNNEIPICLHQNHVFVVRPHAGLLSHFLAALTSSDYGRAYFQSCSKQSTNLASINSTQLKAFPVPLPCIKEQKAIAAVLSTWDRGIRQLTDLIAAKLRFKQGLMQQLLTGKRRFPEFKSRDLKSCELSKFLTLTARPIDRPTSVYKALGLRSHGKGTFFRIVEDPQQVQMETLYQVKKDDLIVNITFAWEGAIAIASEEDEAALVSHRFPTFVFDHSRALPGYLRQIVITPWFIFKMGLVSPGGAGRNRVLKKKDFLRIEIPLPEIDEQARIANFLGQADREIAFHRKQLDTLKQQKKGLMQKLLTGEVKVKVPNNNGSIDGGS